MKTFFRRLLILLIALACLIGPVVLRSTFLRYNQRTYTPPALDTFKIATTPAPTALPIAVNQTTSVAALQPLRRGPIVVDLAHFNRLNPSSFQPLEAALATQGVGLRLWLSTADISKLQSYLDFPDQSDALATQLNDASGMIIVSPFFLWSKPEIALLEKFVANGGRLLLISDPDVQGDFPTATNMVAEPFGVVFNDDYLYDTVTNDENYTHFFQKTFQDQADSLNGSKIAFYGGRSISGAGTAQVHSAPTTLSSLRAGLSDFTTVAIGGQQANQSTGRVLAMSDFDVLTEPYVARFDNQRILAFTAQFLGASQRADTLVNFPAYLGKDVALIVDSDDGVNADLLGQGAQLQQQLAETGRTLSLAGTQLLTTTLVSNTTSDLIYIADFKAAENTATLLHDIGITLVKEITYPTPTPSTPATSTPTPEATTPVPAQSQSLPTITLTATVSAPEMPTDTATPEPTTLDTTATPSATMSTPATTTPEAPQNLLPLVTGAVPIPSTLATNIVPTITVVLAKPALTPETASTATRQPTPTPEITYFLQTNDGLRLQAEQTLLIIQRQRTPTQRMVAVLGFDAQSVKAGITRLLNDDLKDCVLRPELAICPVAAKTPSKATGKATEEATPTPKATPAKGSEPTKESPTPATSKQAILLVDDNVEAKADETSEADFYLQVLTKAGQAVKLWTTAKDGAPTGDDLAKYTWVIWSDAAYASSGIGTDKLQAISDYLGKGGHILLSSRLPFFAVGSKAASPIVDVVTAKDASIPVLVRDLPTEPIALPADLPPVVPLQVNDEVGASAIILRRGPQSSDTNAPVLLVMTDADATNSLGARLMIFGMSMLWLPETVGTQLVNNMAEYMLKDQ